MDQLDLRQDLIEACKRQDRRAQKELYMSYADAMYNVAFRIVKNEEDAQDVLQNAFIEVFRNLEGFKYESTPGAWIKRIVVNKALTFLKRKKRMDFSMLTEEKTQYQDDDDFVVPDSIKFELIKSAINDLPDGYRTVLVLYLLEGYDHKEIGQILGISEMTSKSQYSRAKKKLRLILEAD